MGYWVQELNKWLTEEELKAYYAQKELEEKKKLIKEALIDALMNELDLQVDLTSGKIKITRRQK